MRLIEKINNHINSVCNEIKHPYTIRLFRKLVYSWFLINTLILLPAGEEFWGSNALIPDFDKHLTQVKGLELMLNILNNPSFTKYYPFFIFLQLSLLVLGILCIYPRFVSILIYIVTLNLDNRAYVILDGGNNLLQIMLLYLIIVDPSTKHNPYKLDIINYVNNALSNLCFLMIRLQIVIVYLVSGLAKVDGTLWQNGTALYYTLNIDEYSHPLAKEIISKFPIISVIGTYCTLIYQLAFPWLVWNTKIRSYLLSFGTLIHIQISFVMGLFMFGFAIATSYFAFMTNEVAYQILNFKYPSFIIKKFGLATK